MAFTRPAPTTLHASLTDVVATQHHTATVAGDLNLADLAIRAHSNLSDSPTSAHHILYTDAEAVAAVEADAVLTIQGQIAFPATANPSADGNTLDDYEEGTWTPTVQDDSLNDAESQTYTVQVGHYTKIGNRVFVHGNVTINSLGTLTVSQGVNIGNLPFTSANQASDVSKIGVIGLASLAIPNASEGLTGFIDPNTSKINIFLEDLTTEASLFLISELSTGGRIAFAGHYRV